MELVTYIRILPVSYTHLDVYKRQVWYRPDSSWKKTELYYRTFVGGESLSSVAMELSLIHI